MNATRNMNAIDHNPAPAYRGPLWRLQDKLSPAEQADFQFSTLEDLQQALMNIQNNQVKKQHLQCLVRIKPFLESMQQYGRVIEVFLNTANILAFVWGPMKFILQTASNYAEVFEMIVDNYQILGECLPQFKHYEALFQSNPDMQKVLEYVYEDILDFHRKALKIFRHQRWYYLFFQCTSKRLSIALRGICDNIRRHKSLVENQAHIAHYIESQEAQKHLKDELLKSQQAEQRRQMLYIKEWLSPADYKNDHERYVEVRREYSQTGQWLLRLSQVKNWLAPSNALEPWQLWLYGIPGAGKTVLASMIIEEVKKMQTQTESGSSYSATTTPSIQHAYFYCRHENSNKNNFLAIMRAFIAQLAVQNRESELILLLYEMIVRSEDAHLSSRSEAVELLKSVLKGGSATHTYLIVDGLDECATPEAIVNIIDTLNKIIEPLNIASPGAFRLFLTSRDENIIRKQLPKAVKLKIKPADNLQDIKHYTAYWSSKIQNKFGLSNDERQGLESNIISKTNGMFLFCVLVLQNLFAQSIKEHYYREMDPDTFPKILGDVYYRIFTRIDGRNLYPSQRESAFKIMGSLAFSKRPLKKYEVQGFFAIKVDGTVDYENRALRDDIKDLCGCLVDVYGDSIDFVHTTVKQYLTREKSAEISHMETSLPALCLRYLNSRCYNPELQENEMKEFVLDGSYSLLEYTAIHWIDHIRSYANGLFVGGTGQTEVVSLLTEFCKRFWDDAAVVDGAFSNLTDAVLTSKRDFQTFDCIPELFGKLVHIGSLTLELRGRGLEASSTGPLKRLELTLQKVQRLRERLHETAGASHTLRQKLGDIYGTCIYKCTLQACEYFSEGFSTRDERDKHQRRHNRRYFCPEPGCDMASIGYGTVTSLKLHMGRDHILTQLEAKKHHIRFPCIGMSATNVVSEEPDEDGDSESSSSSTPVYDVHASASESSKGGPHTIDISGFLSILGPDFRITDNLRVGDGGYHLLAKSNYPRNVDIDYLYTCRASEDKTAVKGINFSPDGRYLAIASKRRINVFEAASGKQVGPSFDAEGATSFCLSPDNTYLAAGKGLDGRSLVAWEIVSGAQLTIQDQPDIPPAIQGTQLDHLEFFPDSKRVLVLMDRVPRRVQKPSHDYNEISIWNLVTGSLQVIVSSKVGNRRQGNFDQSVSLSPDGRCLAVGLECPNYLDFDHKAPAKLVRIWDLLSRELVDITPEPVGRYGTITIKFTSPRGVYVCASIEEHFSQTLHLTVKKLQLEEKENTESSNTKIMVKEIHTRSFSLSIGIYRYSNHVRITTNGRWLLASCMLTGRNEPHIVGIWEILDIDTSKGELRKPTLIMLSKSRKGNGEKQIFFAAPQGNNSAHLPFALASSGQKYVSVLRVRPYEL